MLDSERNSHETDNNNEATGHAAGTAPAPTVFNGPAEPAVPAVPAALFQPPQVLFQPPAPVAPPPAGDRDSGDREAGGRADGRCRRLARPARRTRGSRRGRRAAMPPTTRPGRMPKVAARAAGPAAAGALPACATLPRTTTCSALRALTPPAR